MELPTLFAVTAILFLTTALVQVQGVDFSRTRLLTEQLAPNFYTLTGSAGARRGLENARAPNPDGLLSLTPHPRADDGACELSRIGIRSRRLGRQIRNWRVLQQLDRNGDDHAFSRPVDHDIYFRTASDSADFIRAAGELGFQARSGPLEQVQGKFERPFFVNLWPACPQRSQPALPYTAPRSDALSQRRNGTTVHGFRRTETRQSAAK
jgi:hypothetical protein